ncbi:MAG: hypothetical protein IKX58_06855 [Clostridia bacterium]|nr:hypothetical protein [Clostridia bacterium]
MGKLIVGRYQVAVDAQGRLIVPSGWHPDLGDGVVVIRDLSASGEHFLTALTAQAFNSMIDDFAHNLSTDKRYADASRSILQYACNCRFDQKRRISVDSDNLSYAGITGNAVLTANIRSNNPVFEIWEPSALDRNNKAFDERQLQEALERNAEEVRQMQ